MNRDTKALNAWMEKIRVALFSRFEDSDDVDRYMRAFHVEVHEMWTADVSPGDACEWLING